ncbi:MAG: hypothetical protein V7776_04940 [Halopseudomonas aestusnigri]
MKGLKPADTLRYEAPELIEKRTPTSKTYDLGKGRFKVRKHQAQVHYLTDTGLKEIDYTPVDKGKFWAVYGNSYHMRVYKDKPSIKYVRSDGTSVKVALKGIGGIKPNNPPATLEGNSVTWKDVAKDFDLILYFKPSGIELVKVLKSEAAPKLWRMKLTRNGIPIPTEVTGEDAHGRKIDVVDIVDGVNVYTTYTPRVSEQTDKKTRKRGWSTDVVYPVRVV